MTVSHSDLRQAGLRITQPRVIILGILQTRSTEHLSVEDIHRQLIKNGMAIGLATIYRVLSQFEAAGIIKRMQVAGGHSRYEIDQGEHHDHMVCIHCGEVIEFHDEIIERRQVDVASAKGFDLEDHSLILYGRCLRCRQQPPSRCE